jgi:hypothetical protein
MVPIYNILNLGQDCCKVRMSAMMRYDVRERCDLSHGCFVLDCRLVQSGPITCIMIRWHHE